MATRAPWQKEFEFECWRDGKQSAFYYKQPQVQMSKLLCHAWGCNDYFHYVLICQVFSKIII